MEKGGMALPPPPPSSTHKYILTIPIRNFPNLGFHLEATNQSNAEDMIGAQICGVDTELLLNKAYEADFKYLHRVRVGDTVYRIDGELVKEASYRYISSLLLERQDVDTNMKHHGIHEDESKATITVMMERQDGKRRSHASYDDISLSSIIPSGRNSEVAHNATEQIYMEPSNDRSVLDPTIATPNPKSQRAVYILPSPGELSDEGDVLSSIFSPRNYNMMKLNQSVSSNDTSSESYNDCIPSEKPLPNSNCDNHTHHNLMVIPEEPSMDGDVSSDDDAEYFKSSCTALVSSNGTYYYKCLGYASSNLMNSHAIIDSCPTSPVLVSHDNDENTNNNEGEVSPSFSYSVTTASTEQHLQFDSSGPCNFVSPIGSKISDNPSFNSESETVVSRRKFYDTRVQKLRQKYSFLSPDSFRDPTGMDVGSKSCALSCSMSTVYMSPILNTSSGVEPYIPIIAEAQDHSHTIPKNICVQIEKSIDSDTDSFDDGAYHVPEESLHTHPHNSHEVEDDMDAIVIAHAELQDRMDAIIQEREQSEELLKSQIESLETQVNELKQTMTARENESSSRIESLEQSKVQAEKDMDDFRRALEHTTMDAEILVEKLQEKEEAIGELSRKLYKECAAAEACANALAKALAVSEHELMCMKQAKEHSDTRIATLEKELYSSRILIEELTKELERYRAREKDFEKFKQKCKHATNVYKSKIKGLKDIVIERRKVSMNVASQEFNDIQNEEDVAQPPTSLPIKHEKENPFQASTSFRIHTDEELDSNKKKPIVSPANLSNESHEISVRQSKIRAAGGRAALRAKLNLRRKNDSLSKDVTRTALKPYNINIHA